MSNTGGAYAVEVNDLHCRYGKVEAVDGLSFRVEPGRCYGLLGRNGAGKSTTIKCLLNLLRPDKGNVLVHGQDPRRHEVAVKRMIGYVPENVTFHPWMTGAHVLRYFASFRSNWNRALQSDLAERFDLDLTKRVDGMSKGMRSQLALIAAVCPEPQLLLLDEPTSGLDPVVRRDFLQTVIGAYLDGDPGRRTVLVSTHLISEWEGLIEEFTLVARGRAMLSMPTDTAREKFRRLHVQLPPGTDAAETARGIGEVEDERSTAGDVVKILATDYPAANAEETLRARGATVTEVEPLSLEEIFIAVASMKKGEAAGGQATPVGADVSPASGAQ